MEGVDCTLQGRRVTFNGVTRRIMPKRLFVQLWHLPRSAAIALISLYQHTFSPDHGPLRHIYPYGYCGHHPTCSEYGKYMIQKRGLMIGGLMTLGRVLTCNPWRTPDEERLKRAVEAQLKNIL